MRIVKGFTLIESVVAIVIMGFAMVTLTSFLYPQIERSAASQYQTRAVTLGQSMLSQILARGFDHWSDFDGGSVRCGEAALVTNPSNPTNSCTVTDAFGRDILETDPESFNDVDDYIGCWKGTNASSCAGSPEDYPEYDLMDILGNDSSDQYKNFTVLVTTRYVDSSSFEEVSAITTMKKITLLIQAGKWGDYTFIGYRGNY
ncbi:prepilin-type N-terminal cleavage/methylation domain-containing protein [Vibrio sp. ZSDE26]|uniref:Prepilin-type N-terminal cleavage/methylation domain-containing protein n=2 Tax=Vibrio amylolyticus TaxID=2847292 RepID=A0A9X1XMM9_9VIBR|nr:prepilin-type N-terminal cleavage/methylation domain-containing protein [Vibrio amylolyticus]MCK6262269.1 prepilin-type N-terminal cleavage/methylation domain-containing protein [Vibrio amylolyticus]